MKNISKEPNLERMLLNVNEISNIKETNVYPLLNDNSGMQFILKSTFENVGKGHLVLIKSEESKYYLCAVSFDNNNNPLIKYGDIKEPKPLEENDKLIGELEYLVYPV